MKAISRSAFLLSALTAATGCVIESGPPSSQVAPMPAVPPAPATAPAASTQPAPPATVQQQPPAPARPTPVPAPPATAKPPSAGNVPSRPVPPPAVPPPTATASLPPPPPVKPAPSATASSPPPSPQLPQGPIAGAVGQPKSYRDGARVAFWIWQDPGSVKWHLRSTTPGPTHAFTGQISSDGVLGGLIGVKLDPGEDSARMDGKDIDFTFSTHGLQDGFDFVLTGGSCVTFQTLVDGKADASLVFLGLNEVHPGGVPFKLCR